MSRVPRSFVDGYADSLESLSDDMRKKLAESLKRINWEAPVADVRNALVTIMQGYCGSSADVAASLAAEFYDGLRERMIGEKYGAVLAPDYSDEAIDQFVRWAVQPLVDEGVDGVQYVVDRLDERIGYEVKRSAGNTVFRNGERDHRKVRFARVPRGSKSYPHGCPFCQMLASRGFVYRNAKTAGEMNHFHADCQCMVVPGFGDNPTVEGYDPNEYMNRWKHPEKYANEDAEPQEPKLVSPDIQSLQKKDIDTSITACANETNPNVSMVDDLAKQLNALAAEINAMPYETPEEYVARAEKRKEWAALQRRYKKAYREWRENCQRCVPAYEMRRRGYDVQASSRMARNDTVANNWDRLFKGQTWTNVSANTREQAIRSLEQEIASHEDGARFEVCVRWNGRSGHVFVAELQDGEIVYICPQTKNAEYTSWMDRFVPTNLKVSRIDNLEFDEEYLAKTVEVVK